MKFSDLASRGYNSRTVERRVALRAFGLWVLVRLGVAMIEPKTLSNITAADLRFSLLLIAFVVFLSNLEIKRANEDVFAANLGTSRTTLLVVSAIPALVFELLLGLAR